MTRVLAVINFIDSQGRPVDPGFGGGIAGGHPDQGLPGYGHPDNDLPGRPPHVSGGPIFGGRPDQGLPGYGHPDNSLPWAPVTIWPPSPVDPEWGVGAPRPSRPDNSLPPFVPLGPGHPDNALPPFAEHKPPTNPPPGTIWPPLPGNPPAGKAALLVWLVGVGWRYMVVEIPATPAQPK